MPGRKVLSQGLPIPISAIAWARPMQTPLYTTKVHHGKFRFPLNQHSL
jgi:hypothetical protein